MDKNFWISVASALIFGVLGIGMIVFGFKVFDWLMPSVQIEKELAENHNIAVAIVVAAMIIAVAMVVAAVIAA